jgi:hydroxyacylglutathione hydrolase
MINVKKYIVNPFRENSYILSDETGDCMLVDAGFYSKEEQDEVLNYLNIKKLNPIGLISTHCHIDHIIGVDFIRRKFGIPFQCHIEDSSWLSLAPAQGRSFGIDLPEVSPADGYFSGGQTIYFGNSSLLVIHVPGHSAGHVVFYSAENQFLMAGDNLFYMGIGRFDLPGGNYYQLIQSIKEKMLVLPPETKVWSGHGNETTIGFEKLNNPYLI